MYKHNEKLTPLAQTLRKNMTKEEKHLWYDFLKSYPIKFYRQKVIENYIVDFYCSKAKLVIELDGSQHYEKAQSEYDQKRDRYLEGIGYKVLRYSNLDVNLRFPEVCEDIFLHIQGEK